MELGFEFRRDLEQLVHDDVLCSRRALQRINFRPGVLVSAEPVDIFLQQRTKKKLARALRSLCDDYGISLALSKEALAYTNSLEDALNFLALQYTSGELPSTLRVLPKALQGADDVDKSAGELRAEVNTLPQNDAAICIEQKPPITVEDISTAHVMVERREEFKEQKQEAISWTQQYVVNMATSENEIAELEANFSSEHRELQELEKRYNEQVAVLTRLQDRKQTRKTKSGDKLKSRELIGQIRATRRDLVARGWKDPMEERDNKNLKPKETMDVASLEKNIKSKPSNKDDHELLLLATDRICEELDEMEAVKVEEKAGGTSTAAVTEEVGDSDYGVCGLLDEAYASVKSAEAIPKSAAIDTAALIAAQARADLQNIKRKGGKKKKGRNLLKMHAVATHTEASSVASWTGKSPRDHLESYCLKNGLQKPQYTKMPRSPGGDHLYSVVLSSKSCEKQVMSLRDPRDAARGYKSITEAKDAVATSALFELAPNLPLYRVLPPIYRDMWQAWTKKEQEMDAAVAAANREEQDELLTAIFNALPAELAAKRALIETPTPISQSLNKESKSCDNALQNWNVNDWDADFADVETTENIEDNSLLTSDDAIERMDEEMAESESDRNAALNLSNHLRQQLYKQMHSSAYRSKLPQRECLPIASFKTQIVEMLQNHDVMLISGETGCGKSTQVPQFLLEDLLLSRLGGARGQILCTQPRRLAAISLAERVSQELGEAKMGIGDSLTGFQIRLESRMTRHTRLLFCTTGILLRKLQDPRTLGEYVSHVIVDEVHERDLQSDVLLALLRQFLAENNAARRLKFGGTLPPLKVILMSATLQAASFQEYFGGAAVCPMIKVPGRMYPVKQFYLEDVLEMTQYIVDEESPAYVGVDQSGANRKSTQIKVSGRGGTSYTQQILWTSTSESSSTKSAVQETLKKPYSESTLRTLERIDPSIVNYELIQALLEQLITETELLSLAERNQTSASVLIFLPGLQEITTLLGLLEASRLLRHDSQGRAFELLPLHSSLSAQEQQRIFRQCAGVIRIIAATNIAETSLTIDDVKVVIDTGRVKQMRHDAQHRTNVLDEIWVARANAKQRAGRAGRTSGGSCFRLFPESIFRCVMLEQPVPEIQRAPLTSLCLQIKNFGVSGHQTDSCGKFLRACLDPPSDVSIQDALEELFEIGALNRDTEAITALGVHLAHLPVDVKVGKLLLLGALFNVFDGASTCAAVLETKSPFVAPFGRQNEMKKSRQTFAVGASDLLTDVNAFEAWRHVVQRGKRNGVDEKTFCQTHFLSQRGLWELSKLKRHFRGLVAQLGFISATESSRDERMTLEQLATMSAILYAGLAPNLVHAELPSVAYGPQRAIFRERDQNLVVMHPSSINYKVATFHASSFLTYAVKLHTSQVYLPASSLVCPLAVCLFSHTFELLPQLRQKDKDGNETIGVRVNDWIMLQNSFRSAALLQELRHTLHEIVDTSFQTPPYAREDKSETSEQQAKRTTLVDVLRKLLVAEYEERDPKKSLSCQLKLGGNFLEST
ncbi:hypothetical protein CCR75_008433 [Bremia lactucae]|uniref:RNA helicase n=1 Tax=Bremia lactucae TaxID=4779 RepID=A0A976FFU1_BRELC|nr:hypothetical protein CCR75_008433 [Bremia lactucae]